MLLKNRKGLLIFFFFFFSAKVLKGGKKKERNLFKVFVSSVTPSHRFHCLCFHPRIVQIDSQLGRSLRKKEKEREDMKEKQLTLSCLEKYPFALS